MFISGVLQEMSPGARLKGRKVNQVMDTGFAIQLGIQVNDELVAIGGKG